MLKDPYGLLRPTLPVAYPQIVLEIVRGRGGDPAEVLRQARLPTDLLDAGGAFITPLQYTLITTSAAQLLGDRGLGMEVGLRMRPTAHGFLGYALLSCNTLREALMLALRFMRLRQRQILVSFREEGPRAIVRLREAHAFGPVRHYFIEGLLIGFARSAQYLVDNAPLDLELWLDYPEPAYFERYREALPELRFARSEIQLRMPKEALELPLRMADPVASRQAIAACEQELARCALGDELVPDVRAMLADRVGNPPRLAELANALFLSPRTLKRRLTAQGTTYQRLLDEVRAEEARRLLALPGLRLERIGAELGYIEPASFTRAFRRWTGVTPSAFRARLPRVAVDSPRSRESTAPAD